MSRVMLAIVLSVTMAVGWISAPDRGPVDPPPRLEPAAAAAAVCPLRIDRTVDGQMTIASTVLLPPGSPSEASAESPPTSSSRSTRRAALLSSSSN
jgi:hypothetical protein